MRRLTPDMKSKEGNPLDISGCSMDTMSFPGKESIPGEITVPAVNIEPELIVSRDP